AQPATPQIESQHLALAEAEPGLPASAELAQARPRLAEVSAGTLAQRDEPLPDAAQTHAQLVILFRGEARVVAPRFEQGIARLECECREVLDVALVLAHAVHVAHPRPLALARLEPFLEAP